MIARPDPRFLELDFYRLLKFVKFRPLITKQGCFVKIGDFNLLISYLELALREGLALATLDKNLIKAAKKTDVPLYLIE